MSMHAVTVNAPAGTITGLESAGVRHFHSLRYCVIPSPFAAAEPAAFGPQDARDPHPDEVALSITAPAAAKDAPVLVYIHGGRFETGTHEDARVGGEAAARAGFVQVQVGYRVGPAGFARLNGEVPFHFRGIDDCQLALEWIQRNVGAFGGDPTNVTLAGQSAGATAALWLARRDHYCGAFRRVLALSPCFPRESFEARTRRSLTRADVDSLSGEQVQERYRRFRKRYPYDMALGPSPLDCAEFAEIPIVVASTRDEFYDHPAAEKSDALPTRRFAAKYMARKFDLPAPMYRQWEQVALHLDPRRPLGRLIGDATIRRWVAQVAQEAPGPTWMLEFVRRERPALHCDDLPVLFGVTGGALPGFLCRFLREGDPGLPAYRPEHSVYEYDLDTGRARVVRGALDYVAAAFS